MSVQSASAPHHRALFAASAVFVLGFGVLAIASAAGLGDQSLPGLYTFRSATIGDGLLLPLLAYSLVRAAGEVRPLREKRAVAVAAFIGVLAGVATQVQWLMNPGVVVNWTLPTAGTFNVIGWYHAVFLVGACGFFAGLVTAVVVRLRRERVRAERRTRAIGILCVLAPALAFVSMWAEDNGIDNVLDLLVWLIPLTLLAVVVLIMTIPDSAAWCVIACVATLLPALSVGLLFLPGRTSEVLTVLPAVCAVLVGAAASSALALGADTGRVVVPLCVAACAAGPVYAIGGLPTVTVSGLLSGCAASTAAVITELLLLRVLLERQDAPVRAVVLLSLATIPVIAYSLLGRLFGQHPDWVGQYAIWAASVVSALYLWVSAKLVRASFNAVIAAEVVGLERQRLAGLKWTAYTAIITTYAGAMLACVVVLIGASAGKWNTGSVDGMPTVVVLGVIAAVLLVINAATPSSIRAAVACVSCLGWTALISVQLLSGYGDWKQAVLSVVVTIAVILFVLEGVAGNAAYLHLQPVGLRVAGTAACAALAAGSTISWLTGPALWSTTGVVTTLPALTSVVIGAAGCVALPWFAARSLPGAAPPYIYRTATPLEGVFQDCTLVTLLALSLAWAPNLFLAHLDDVASWVGAAFPFLALLTAAYVNVMKNNIGHVHRERKRVAAEIGTPLPPDEQRALDALAIHIKRQNVIALVAMVPFGLLMLATEINVFSDEGVRGGFRRITTP